MLRGLPALLLCAGLLLAGCASQPPARNGAAASGHFPASTGPLLEGLSPERQAKILALDPDHVTDREVRECLRGAPAPRIINIHGGLLPFKGRMNSFALFLMGMGYPEASLRNHEDDSYTYGYYDDSDMVAGVVAWYYEHDGLRPMLMGHSLGGIQAVRVLHMLAGNDGKELRVYNPVSHAQEDRQEITDPLTGETRPVLGLQTSYVTASVAGGLGRVIPKEWDMNNKLREIPDTVEEFTGFQKGMDILGGDFLGYGRANEYRATGTAVVRNVRLPSNTPHIALPDISGLLKQPRLLEWINAYAPAEAIDPEALSRSFGKNSGQILWAAEVWYGIKKHWVIELQRLICARNG